jgi:hypothetical protein
MDLLFPCALVYLSIGSVIWIVLDLLGVIGTAFKPQVPGAIVLATLMMIVGWPLFVAWWVRGMVRVR